MQSLSSMFISLGIWNWWILAGILLALELLVPSFFFLWFAAAALEVGLLALFIDLNWQFQVGLFAVLSVVNVAAARHVLALLKRGEAVPDDPFLNRRADRHVGKVFTSKDGIKDGRGRIHIDDTVWMASGPDCAPGARLRVIGVDGTTLLVEPAD